jgi:hypothetical protein
LAPNRLLQQTAHASDLYQRCIVQIGYTIFLNLEEFMGNSKRRYSKEEFARRGDALVESNVRPNLTAADRLRKRVPDPQIWLVHVTLGYLHRIGGIMG